MRADGPDAPSQVVGDLPDTLAAPEKTQHLILPVGQSVLRRPLGVVTQDVEQFLGDGRIHISSSVRQLPDGSDQLRGRRPFADVPGRAGTKGAQRKAILGVTVEDEDGKSWMLAL